MTRIPKYWTKAKKYLSKKDKKMAKLIMNYKSPSETVLTSRRDIFFDSCSENKALSMKIELSGICSDNYQRM